MVDKKTELSVSAEVLEKIAELAATEVSGVKSLSKKNIDLRGAVKSKTAFKGVKVESINGALEINVYICVTKDAHVRETSENVQRSVKDKIQEMTGTAVTRVNVVVSDVESLDEPEE